jgi:hypothetical protein
VERDPPIGLNAAVRADEQGDADERTPSGGRTVAAPLEAPSITARSRLAREVDGAVVHRDGHRVAETRGQADVNRPIVAAVRTASLDELVGTKDRSERSSAFRSLDDPLSLRDPDASGDDPLDAAQVLLEKVIVRDHSEEGVRVFLGRCAIARFRLAALAAFLTFFFAAAV